MQPVLSVVIPMYDEQDVLPLLVARLRPALDALGTTYEVVAVDASAYFSRPGPRMLPTSWNESPYGMPAARMRVKVASNSSLGMANARC